MWNVRTAKGSDDRADYAGFRIVRLEIFAGRASHLDEDKREVNAAILFIPLIRDMRRRPEAGTFSHDHTSSGSPATLP